MVEIAVVVVHDDVKELLVLLGGYESTEDFHCEFAL